jgi:hypothetical protein
MDSDFIREMERVMDELIRLCHEDSKNRKEENGIIAGSISCPQCGGKRPYGIFTGNGHLHTECPSGKCAGLHQ